MASSSPSSNPLVNQAIQAWLDEDPITLHAALSAGAPLNEVFSKHPPQRSMQAILVLMSHSDAPEQLALIEVLLWHGVSPNASNPLEASKAPLVTAIERGLPQAVELLLRYGASTTFERPISNALHALGTSKGDVAALTAIIPMLVQAGCSLDGDGTDPSPLQRAVSQWCAPAVEALLAFRSLSRAEAVALCDRIERLTVNTAIPVVAMGAVLTTLMDAFRPLMRADAALTTRARSTFEMLAERLEDTVRQYPQSFQGDASLPWTQTVAQLRSFGLAALLQETIASDGATAPRARPRL